jgi:hypothetical protein
MRRSLTILTLAAALAAGCASTSSTTPAQVVFATKGAYATALTAAVAYESLRRCAPAVPKPCSDPDLVAQIRKADNVAAAALEAAEAAVRTPAIGTTARDRAIQAAQAALAAFSALVTSLGAPS